MRECNLFYYLFKDIEAVLTSPDSLDKGDVYKHVGRMIGGDGLFSMGGM